LSKIELYRAVTLEEIEGNPSRWRGYVEGDVTSGFDSTNNLIKHARKVTRKYFPGFKLDVSEA